MSKESLAPSNCKHPFQPDSFCSACLALINPAGIDLTHSCGQYYNFTKLGWFALISENNLANAQDSFSENIALESFYIEIFPLLDRMKSHICWLMMIAASLLFFPASKLLFYLMAAAFMSSCLLIGYYWSALMMGGSFRPLFCPQPQERHFRLCLKGKVSRAEAYLQKRNLVEHPGCLSNMALAFFNAGDFAKGKAYLEKALNLAPHHPAILSLQRDLSTKA